MTEEKKKPFDLKTHIRDPKSGQLINKQPYKLTCLGSRMVYQRNGIMYNPDGTEIITPEILKARKEAAIKKEEQDRLIQERIEVKKKEAAANEKFMKEIQEEDAKKVKEDAEALVRAEEEKKAFIEEEKVKANKQFPKNKPSNK